MNCFELSEKLKIKQQEIRSLKHLLFDRIAKAEQQMDNVRIIKNKESYIAQNAAEKLKSNIDRLREYYAGKQYELEKKVYFNFYIYFNLFSNSY